MWKWVNNFTIPYYPQGAGTKGEKKMKNKEKKNCFNYLEEINIKLLLFVIIDI